jgi:hypothetical protein
LKSDLKGQCILSTGYLIVPVVKVVVGYENETMLDELEEKKMLDELEELLIVVTHGTAIFAPGVGEALFETCLLEQARL